MTAAELLNQAADLIERNGWLPADNGDNGWDAKCVSNAIYHVWRANHGSGLLTESMDAVKEIIDVGTLEDLWRWNDTVCLDQAEAVNMIRKAAESVEGRKR